MSLRMLLTAAFLVALPVSVLGHGRLIDPPQRSSMWRFNFSTPENYNDNQLYCGGAGVQHNNINRGRCGECGDEWSIPRPRPNDEGGLYGTGIITKNYTEGQIVRLTVELTTSHLGHFEFRLCRKSSASQLVTRKCLNKNRLALSDGRTEFIVPSYREGYYYPKVKLPPGLTCDNCVLQWYYLAGNSWGECPDGTFDDGCGNQETYVNCADIAILPKKH